MGKSRRLPLQHYHSQQDKTRHNTKQNKEQDKDKDKDKNEDKTRQDKNKHKTRQNKTIKDRQTKSQIGGQIKSLTDTPPAHNALMINTLSETRQDKTSTNLTPPVSR